MRRRSFLQSSLAGMGAMAGGSFPGLQTARAADARGSRPNILVFVADDAGWSDFGFHGSEIMTPVMDRLANQGAELDHFHVHPVCSPTRAAFMTGRPPSRFNILGPLQTWSDQAFPDGTVTVAEHLRRQGYETMISGKWHLGMTEAEAPHNWGFDHTYGYVGPWIDSYTHYTTNFHEDDQEVRQWHRNGTLIDEEGHVTDLIADEAVRFLTEFRDPGKPFFLYVPFSAPHTPIQEDEEWLGKYDGVIDNTARKFFAAAMTHMDAAMGRVMTALAEEGLDNDTLVVFFSDNGGTRGGDFSGWLKPPKQFYMTYVQPDSLSNNLPLRNNKGSLYDGGVRVAAFARWPGMIGPGTVDTHCRVEDLYPTFLHLAGADIPDDYGVEGINIWPALQNESLPDDRVFYWRTGRQLSVRKGPWKLLHFGGEPSEGRDELYHMVRDPYEKNDVAASNPDIVTGLKRELERQYAGDPVH